MAEGRSIISNEIIKKIDELIKSDKIKKIIFLPSKTQVWEIKSNTNDKTYWIDLERNCCSCRGFYYNFKKGKCYHIQAAYIAVKHNKYKVKFLDDSEINNHAIAQIIDLIDKDN